MSDLRTEGFGACSGCGGLLWMQNYIDFDLPTGEANEVVLEIIEERERKCPRCDHTVTPTEFGFERHGDKWQKTRWAVVPKAAWLDREPRDLRDIICCIDQ